MTTPRSAQCLLALTALATTAVAATSRPATTRPTKVFASDEYGFKLKVPADWILPERPDEGQVFTVWMPLHQPTTGPATDQKLQVGGVGLRVEQGPAGVPDRAIVRDLTGTIADHLFNQADKGIRHVTIKPAKVGFLPAREVAFTVDHPGGPLSVLYVVAVRKGTEYVFNTAAPSEQMDKLLPEIRAMLASFDLKE